ncbi:amidohydrolase family protein [Agromyces sp. MMS24-K17]|uniref:amidohydrolase family protein n=1 Tax=Agromyces sp. MMS24-K17 TaxID=3372850 RepID=UPI0037551B3A
MARPHDTAVLLDTHVHVWDPTRLDYLWLAGLPALDHPFLPAEVDRADGATARMVFVQADCRADQSLDEAHWVAGLAADWPELAGIVAAADLRSASLAEHLDALADIGGPDGTRLVRGIRHLLQGEPVEAFADPALRRGLELLAERGIPFDACVVHPQLDALADLLDAVPELDVVLDHVGKPPVDAGLDSDAGRAWADALDRLADRPGTHVKLSGLAAEASDRASLDAHADAFLARALDAFGADRAMLGSDWPVSARLGAGGSFADWAARVRRVAEDGGHEWAAIAGGTGARVYGLA